MTFTCPQCDTEFILEGKKLGRVITDRKRNKAGPFCGKSCAGRYSASVQNRQKEKMEVKPILPSYRNLKSGV